MAQDLESLLLPVPSESSLARRHADLSHGELPAHLLRRILSLTSSVGPDTGLDSFAERLAQVACEMGGFPWTLVFLLDSADDAFYAEANHGLPDDDWPEVLAVTVPRRVYEQVAAEAPVGDHLVELRAGDALLRDGEIAACYVPLLRLLDPSAAVPADHPPRGSLLLVSLDVPGRGTIGFCVCGRAEHAPPLRLVTRRALQALAAQGAIFTEHIHLYRQRMEEAAVSTALLQVANVVGTTDLDLLVKRTLAVLPRLFGGQIAALLYLDRRRGELRMLEPAPSDGALTALTEVLLSPSRLEQLDPILRGSEPLTIEELAMTRVLPDRLVQTRGLRSALIIPLHLSNRPADALAVFWTAASHRFRPRDSDVARGVAELVGVALANAQLYADATTRAEQLASLYRTGQMMSSSLDLEETLRTIAAAAVQLTRSTRCVIYLIDPDSGLLDLAAASGLDASASRPTSLRPGEGLLGRCALAGKPLLIEDLHSDEQHPGTEPSLGADVRAALFLPLIASGEVIGVLATTAATPGYFGADHQQILQAFANQAAVAIERARLYASEQRRRELAELQQSMIQSLGATLELRDVLGQVLEHLKVLIGFDLATVHVHSGGEIALSLAHDGRETRTDEPFHTPFLLHEPLYAQMCESGVAVVVADTRREPLWRAQRPLPNAASWIGAPLLIDADYLVLLDLFSLNAGRYRQADADHIAQYAHQVGFAVRNARIYAREREAKMRLEELDQLRTDFVSTVSHELRTPLTGIKGFTETLLTYWDRLDDEKRHHYLDRIHGASKRLQRLVQDLLFVSKVEGGSLPLAIRQVDLHDLIEFAVMEITQKYRGQEITLAVPESLPLVLADTDRAQQVLVNLMDNGVKYSPEGAAIAVECTVQPSHVRLAVTDHGPGIRPQDMPKLFTRFGKIDQVIRAGHVGTGLGLFISRQLVEQMQGIIEVESVVGQGSVFSFTLPRADIELAHRD